MARCSSLRIRAIEAIAPPKYLHNIITAVNYMHREMKKNKTHIRARIAKTITSSRLLRAFARGLGKDRPLPQ
jgi:hypothetical protein